MILFLNELTKEELSAFELFLHSPYFSRNKSLIFLFDYLKPLYPLISEKDISYEALSKNVLKEKVINKVKIRKMTSDFSKTVESFLLQSEREKDLENNKILLLKAFRKRGLTKKFNIHLNSLQNSAKNSFSKDDSFYLTVINLIDLIFNMQFSEYKLKFADILQTKSDSIDYLFVFLKLHTFNEMMNNEIGRKERFDKKLFDEVISFVNNNEKEIISEHPNIYIIYLVVLMNKTGDDKYVEKLKKYLNLNEKKFNENKLSYYYHYVRAYYVNKMNQGKTEYRSDLFEIFKIMRRKNLMLIDNNITDMEFNSAINTALPLKEFNWINSFIKEYKDFIIPAYASDAYNLAISKVLYEKKEYNKIFEHLNKVEFKDPVYYSNSKFILARVYYDSKNFLGVKYIIDNLRQYSRTNKNLSADHIAIIKLFNKYMNELLNIAEVKSNNISSLKVILKKQIQNEKLLVTNVSWFYKKIDEL